MENGVSDLRSQFDPAQPEDSPEMPAAFEADNAPTMTVDLPEDMSFSDFDPEVNSAVDDDGIPIWEDPA